MSSREGAPGRGYETPRRAPGEGSAPPAPPFTGGCLCDTIRYVIVRRSLRAIHCHCRMCRKAHGGAYSTHAICRPHQIRFLAGLSALVLRRSSERGYRGFCARCGSHIIVHGQSGDGTVAVPAGTLDGDPPLIVLGHMFDRERVGWAPPDDGLPRYPEWPPGSGPALPAAGVGAAGGSAPAGAASRPSFPDPSRQGRIGRGRSQVASRHSSPKGR